MGKDKHSENTSEYSKPHTSSGCPEEHVDQLHFAEEGKHDSRLDVDHITDTGAIQMGQETYDFHQSNKEESDKDQPDKEDGSKEE